MTIHGSAERTSWRESRPALPPTRHRPPPSPAQLRFLAEFAYHGDMQEAADCVGRSYHTVKNRLGALYERLDVTCATQALLAVGWLHLPEAAS